MLHSVSLSVHQATWHMWRRCRDLLVWINHSDVLLVLEECTHPLSGTLAVHARSKDVHTRTHSLTHMGTRGGAFLYEDPPHVII